MGKRSIFGMKLGLTAIAGLLLAGCPAPPAGVRYFLVAEAIYEEHGDSYVLPLSDLADIAHAEALIDDPESAGEPIVLAKIAEGGSDGAYVNRDLTGSGAAWSWRITEFVGFADFTIEIYDGWPTYVEDNYDDFVSTTDGMVGFWNYTIVREVAPCELRGTCADAVSEHPPHSPLAL